MRTSCQSFLSVSQSVCLFTGKEVEMSFLSYDTLGNTGHHQQPLRDRQENMQQTPLPHPTISGKEPPELRLPLLPVVRALYLF